jgi:hypothetical protein
MRGAVIPKFWKNQSLQIFMNPYFFVKRRRQLANIPNDDFSRSDDERIPILYDKESSGNDISKYLSEHIRKDSFNIMKQKNDRGLVQ